MCKTVIVAVGLICGAAGAWAAAPPPPFAGEAVFTTESRWHSFAKLEAEIVAQPPTLPVSTELLGDLADAEHAADADGDGGAEDDPASTPDEAVVAARREAERALTPWVEDWLDGLAFRPADAATFAKFAGGGQRSNLTRESKITRLEAARVEGAPRPTVRLKVEASVSDGGKLGNRFGPNTWSNQWKLSFEVTIVRGDDGSDRVESLELSFAIDGGFFTPGANIAEAWTARGTGRLNDGGDAEADGAGQDDATDAARARQVEALVRQLGDDRFARREAAEAELRGMGEPIRPLLESHLEATDDPEIRLRLEHLLNPVEQGWPDGPRTWYRIW